ncbi:LpxL/LpxP family Kdo(2)-lipid IV(A) lauroyl/palmitoleoyl acyltransferase [Vibrio breoganii]|uniref:Lipid A biosynthesis acyltransferase n=1 Tax=Vibrio breoganii TaxID=553239 RepID=A0AAP8MWR5_9VIBR|nr:LpxL/LpxP family Kdo(2)-lipid IV(A) lauroyl/palmitoleoyl acyltransferase [Vibrio breoganii]NMO72872.1 LpxL/LpxP family Kdo(2)-lipid IV(A) lauroyl/palmitoleoyl acyltransferase [Vibrio breoganii]NMR69950.1 LpxL/LpxP family Kdo(2)-lipid IV(A) lauroyl/palmitoleoyl acyltransferase [Vibrio breoganii]OCH77875.1 lipid A biosynthesis lauroyl acyltransferase [Vibrio breoganii]OED99444.1 lipid A biosynthesis lauroyl acyltransferase [Vibrio breoganii ZF-29]OEF87012.1 lipid A biosynthesis lauroyl acyltr
MNKYAPPQFSFKLLHPKYWSVWISFGVLALLVNLLPYAVLYKLGRGFGKYSSRLAKSRVKVIRRNIELAFPDKTAVDAERIVEENIKNTGLAFVEMGITWFWPTWRLKRRIRTVNLQQAIDFENEGRGVLLCHPHTLNLEISARAFAVLGYPGSGVYRPNNNPAYDFIQYWGRTHNGNKLVDRKDVKEMIRVLKRGERLFYLGDHDYGRNKSVFVPFFAVKEACTTTGANMLYSLTNCAMIPVTGFRDDRGQYELNLADSIHEEFPKKDLEAGATLMNQAYEQVILRQVDQWMWVHKRYKTMKDESLPKGYRYKQ